MDTLLVTKCLIEMGRRILSLRRESTMLWTIFVIIVILWLLGLVSGYTMGGVVHVLLLIAIALLIVRLNQRRIRLNQRRRMP